jgi:hypothetical protein
MIGLISLIGLIIYFLPSIIAALNHHRSMRGIFLVNLLLGWSGLGWLIVLIIAMLG